MRASGCKPVNRNRPPFRYGSVMGPSISEIWNEPFHDRSSRRGRGVIYISAREARTERSKK